MPSSIMQDEIPNLSVFGSLLKKPSAEKPISRQSQAATAESNFEIGGQIVPRKKIPEKKAKNKIRPMALIDQNLPQYKDIFKSVEKQEGRGSFNGYHLRVSEWVKEGNPVLLLPVANDIAMRVQSQLFNDAIPFIEMKKLRRTVFVVRKEDEERLRDVVDTIYNQLVRCVRAYDYIKFNDLCELRGEPVTYLTNLDEGEMEFIRRRITEQNCDTEYSMFRMNDTLWGLGIRTLDFLAVPSSENPLSFAEAYLHMLISLHGANGKENRKILMNDYMTDRAVSERFYLGLQSNPQVYVYDPDHPRMAIKFLQEGYQCSWVYSAGYRNFIKEGALIDYNTPEGQMLLYKKLSSMNHKVTTYTQNALLEHFQEWKHRDKKAEKEKLLRRIGEQQIAHIIFQNFVREHDRDQWLRSSREIEQQRRAFQEDSIAVIQAIVENYTPHTYPEEQAAALFHAVDQCEYNVKTFENLIPKLQKMEVREISDGVNEKYTSLNEILRNIDPERTNVMPEISIDYR